METVEAGLTGTGRPVSQGDVEPALWVYQPGASQHAVLDELGPQPQAEQPAVPGHAAGKVGDWQLDLRDPVQPGDSGWHGSHLQPTTACRGPDAGLPIAARRAVDPVTAIGSP
jgi:hypothetical protein